MKKLIEQSRLLQLQTVTVLAMLRKVVVDRQLLATVNLPRWLEKVVLLAQKLDVPDPRWAIVTMTFSAVVMKTVKMLTPTVGPLQALRRPIGIPFL